LRNGSGFQGVLNHPQVFGPSMALLASWTLSAVLSDARPSWKNLAILGVSMWFILASEARTAGLAVVLGAGIALLHAIFRSGVQVTARLPGLRSKKVYAVIFVGTLLGVLQ